MSKTLGKRFFILSAILVLVIIVVLILLFFKKTEPTIPEITPTPVRPKPEKIFFINLEYFEGKLVLKDISVDNGFVPDYKNQPERGFLCQVLNQEGIIYSLKFDIAPPLFPPPLPGETHTEEIPPGPIEVSLIIPYFDQAKEIVFYDPDGRLLLTIKVPEDLLGFFLPQALAQEDYTTIINNGDPEDKFDVLYLGDNYTEAEMLEFENDIERFYQLLLGIEPFFTYSKSINIHRVNNTTDLACTSSVEMPRLITCSTSLVNQVALVAPHDLIVVLVDDSDYGGSGGPYFSVAYNGSYGPEVAVHESGHTFGRLADEYIVNHEPLRDAPNCTPDPECNDWKNIPNTGCFQGCNFNDYYRSTNNNCLMRTLSPDGGFNFCPICEAQLTSLLSVYSPTPTETTAPTNTPTPVPTPTSILTPTSTPTPIPTPTSYQHCLPLGDIDCSGKVNSFDFSYLLINYNSASSLADLDNSGLVDALDVYILLTNYGDTI